MNLAVSVVPVDHYSFPTPNNRHYPPSFSKPLVWTDAWPFPNSACPCPSCLSHARSQLGTILSYIYRSSIPLGLAWIKWQWFPKQRQEVWPILWSATSSNRCRSEWINGDAEPQCIMCWAPDQAAELFLSRKISDLCRSEANVCDLKCNCKACKFGQHKQNLILSTKIKLLFHNHEPTYRWIITSK